MRPPRKPRPSAQINDERYTEEADQVLLENKKPKAAKGRKAVNTRAHKGPTLFVDDELK
jgi:hypothetical protein